MRWGRTNRYHVAFFVFLAAVWGILVDFNVIPILSPTGNSTIVQASTAAFFAVLGILYGPIPGALGGLVRDGSGHILLLLVHPGLGTLGALGRAIPDILEDVMLGLIPGIVGQHTRRLRPLLIGAGAAAWISLPFLEVGNVVVAGRPDRIWPALMTAPGDWNEPVDPGLTVYALLAAAMVALAVAPHTSNRRQAYLTGTILLILGVLMIALGAHG